MSAQTDRSRAPDPKPVNDAVLPFEVTALDLRGRIVRLGPAVDTIIEQHGYPRAVGRLLAEALTLTALLGSALKIEGRLILQTKTDGVVPLMVIDYRTPGSLRAYARHDPDVKTDGKTSGELLGRGHLAMTIDQGPDTARYQGLVALEGGSLEEAAHEYFLRSEQIPTRVRLAAGHEFSGDSDGRRYRWRAGGVLVQFLPQSSRQALEPETAAALAPPADRDDAWFEAQSLMTTIDDVELIDPRLSAERLVYRLFHERGVRVFPHHPLKAQCSCSRQAVAAMLTSFAETDRADMIENGTATVTCEFCNARYVFTPQELGLDDR